MRQFDIKHTTLKNEIVDFVKDICKQFNLRADYLTEKDIYRITKNGRAVMSFHTENFFIMPPRMRKNHIIPMIKRGLMLNLGEAYYENSYMKNHGKRIC